MTYTYPPRPHLRGNYPNGLPRVLGQFERVRLYLIDGRTIEGMVVEASGYQGVPTALCLDVGVGTSGLGEEWVPWAAITSFVRVETGASRVFADRVD